MGSVYRKQSATGSLKMEKALTIILAVLIQTAVFAQFTQRQSFNTVKEVHDFGEKKLCICNFCAFLVDEDSQIQYLSKSKTGLSAADLSCGGAEENGKYFCIGYNSGDIDIFFEGKDRFQIKTAAKGLSNFRRRVSNRRPAKGKAFRSCQNTEQKRAAPTLSPCRKNV